MSILRRRREERQAPVVEGDGASAGEAVSLVAEGVVAEGTIKALRETGTVLAGHPEMQIELIVAPDEGEPYRATVTQVLSRRVLDEFQPGAVVPLRVSPEDPQVLMIA
ncbi:MAG TPA: hypothetical protein VHX88_10695 [Solirubrobacteraceae bacterium]|jgi:hypothetical protein|nr:hypothetical protein [Solirubrobacteraceae bacterium]